MWPAIRVLFIKKKQRSVLKAITVIFHVIAEEQKYTISAVPDHFVPNLLMLGSIGLDANVHD